MSTLSVPTTVSPRDDAILLSQSFKGFGCVVAAVIGILAHRDAKQRDQIQYEYKTMYSEELLKRLSSELSGKLETAVLFWMHNPAKRDAIILKQGLTGSFHNPDAVVEVICSRTPYQIQILKTVYYSLFGIYLDNDLERQVSRDLKTLLLAYVTTTRPAGTDVNNETVQNDAVALYEAGEKRMGVEKTFIRIFSERSSAHLASVNHTYRDKYGNSLKKAVRKETSGKFQSALLTILRCAENPSKYFAKGLYKAMKGLGTDDTKLIRIIVTRTEVDMQHIKFEFQKKYTKSLNEWVYSETSRDYRKFLLSLLGPDD